MLVGDGTGVWVCVGVGAKVAVTAETRDGVRVEAAIAAIVAEGLEVGVASKFWGVADFPARLVDVGETVELKANCIIKGESEPHAWRGSWGSM